MNMLPLAGSEWTAVPVLVAALMSCGCRPVRVVTVWAARSARSVIVMAPPWPSAATTLLMRMAPKGVGGKACRSSPKAGSAVGSARTAARGARSGWVSGRPQVRTSPADEHRSVARCGEFCRLRGGPSRSAVCWLLPAMPICGWLWLRRRWPLSVEPELLRPWRERLLR